MVMAASCASRAAGPGRVAGAGAARTSSAARQPRTDTAMTRVFEIADSFPARHALPVKSPVYVSGRPPVARRPFVALMNDLVTLWIEWLRPSTGLVTVQW